MLRVGVVESILTPETVSPQHRPNSYAGETSGSTAANNESHQQEDRPSSSSHATAEAREARARTGLNLPVSEITRSSYMTTSTTASRMSGLSDFPVPPKDHRMSLSAYFNEPLPPPFTEQQQQHLSSLGSDDDDRDDVGDLANTLSLSS